MSPGQRRSLSPPFSTTSRPRADLQGAALAEVKRFLLQEIVEPYLESDVPAPDSINRILMTFCDAIESHPHHVRLWLEWSVSIRKGLWDPYLVFYRAALDAIGRILARGTREGSLATSLDLEDAARVVVGLAHMIVQMRFSGSDRDQVVHTVKFPGPRLPATRRIANGKTEESPVHLGYLEAMRKGEAPSSTRRSLLLQAGATFLAAGAGQSAFAAASTRGFKGDGPMKPFHRRGVDRHLFHRWRRSNHPLLRRTSLYSRTSRSSRRSTTKKISTGPSSPSTTPVPTRKLACTSST